MVYKHREMLKSLANLLPVNKNDIVSLLREDIRAYTDDNFIAYWKDLIFHIPTRVKIILDLVNEGIFESSFLFKILGLNERDCLEGLMEQEKFSEVLTVLRYLIYDHFMGYNLFKKLCIDVKETLKSINLETSFFGFVEEDSIFTGTGVKLNEYPKHDLLLQYISQYSSDFKLISEETCNVLLNYSSELYLEFDSFFDSKEVLIKEVLNARGVAILIKVRLLYFLVVNDIENLKTVLNNSEDRKFLALFIENLLSARIPQLDEYIIYLKEYLNENPNKMEIAEEMLPYTEIDQKTFFELFGISRPQYKIYTETENDLKRFVKELKYTEIQQMSDILFLKEFFEIVTPSISHFLVYTEKLKDILINRLKDEDFNKEFTLGITKFAGERITYLNVITYKLSKAGILRIN